MVKRKTIIRLTAFSIITLLFVALALAGLEVCFRFDNQYGRAGYVFDENLIWRLNKNLIAEKKYAQGKVPDKPPFTLRFNNRGFRGAKLKKLKLDGVKRIMILGDSYTAGLDYPDEEIFTAQLENLLNKRGDEKYEVFNVSCPAWGTDQHFVYWETEGKYYHPDYLIIMIAPNDMREMYNKKLVVLDEQGEIKVNKARFPGKDRIGWKLANRSAFFQYLQKKVLKSNLGDFFKIFQAYPVNYGKKDSTDWDMPIFLKDPFQEVEETYQLFDKILLRMIESCEASGTTLFIGKIPTKSEFDHSYETEEHSPEKITEMIAQIAGNHQIPFLNLNEILKKDDDPLRVFMSWEYHFNKEGHDFTAKHLYQFFNENQ